MVRMKKQNNLPCVESLCIMAPIPGELKQIIKINGNVHEYYIYIDVNDVIKDLFNYYYLTINDIKDIKLMW